MPPLWAVPRLQAFVNFTSIINEGSGVLASAAVQQGSWLWQAGVFCIGNTNFGSETEKLSCRHGLILCGMFTDREAFPLSLSPRAPVES